MERLAQVNASTSIMYSEIFGMYDRVLWEMWSYREKYEKTDSLLTALQGHLEDKDLYFTLTG